MTNIDISNVWPYSEIQNMTADGQAMVYIPKIYVNNTKLKDGPYAGKYQYSIAKEKLDDDWHVHPAFMYNGKEMSGIQIGKYIASKDSSNKAASVSTTSYWTNLTRDAAHTAGLSRNVTNGTSDQKGWHCYNIYEHHLIVRLMLIEYGSTNLQTFLTGEEKSTNATYHGIEMVCGGNPCGFWLDGIDSLGSNKTTWRIFKNDGSQAYVDTGIEPANVRYMPVTDVLHNTGNDYDMNDIFLGSAVDSDSGFGSFCDYQDLVAGCTFSTSYESSTYRGPLYFCCPSSDTDSHLGFRLARYAE